MASPTHSMDEFEQTLGDSEGQENLACCSPGDHRVRHDLVTEQQVVALETFCIYLTVQSE